MDSLNTPSQYLGEREYRHSFESLEELDHVESTDAFLSLENYVVSRWQCFTILPGDGEGVEMEHSLTNCASFGQGAIGNFTILSWTFTKPASSTQVFRCSPGDAVLPNLSQASEISLKNSTTLLSGAAELSCEYVRRSKSWNSTQPPGTVFLRNEGQNCIFSSTWHEKKFPKRNSSLFHPQCFESREALNS